MMSACAEFWQPLQVLGAYPPSPAVAPARWAAALHPQGSQKLQPWRLQSMLWYLLYLAIFCLEMILSSKRFAKNCDMSQWLCYWLFPNALWPCSSPQPMPSPLPSTPIIDDRRNRETQVRRPWPEVQTLTLPPTYTCSRQLLVSL